MQEFHWARYEKFHVLYFIQILYSNFLFYPEIVLYSDFLFHI